MHGTLLIPLDGSARAETALRFAELIPSRTVRLVTVEPVRLSAARERWARGEVPPQGGTWLISSPAAYLELLATPLRDQGRAVEVVVTAGKPEQRIVESAADTDLIIMATRGGGATALLVGGTADYVAHRAPVPTLLVRDVPAAPIERIVVPLDGSTRAEEAIPLAATLRRELGATIHLVRAIDPSASIATTSELQQAAETYLQRRIQSIDDAVDVSYEIPVVRVGSVADSILQVVQPGDLFVMASRRRRRLGQLLLGSVTVAVVGSAPVTVVLVPGILGDMAAALRAAQQGGDQRDGE